MIAWFAAHPTASNLLLILLLAIGALSAPSLIRETFPEYNPTEVSITMEYRGAAAADVEEAICQRLDEALLGEQRHGTTGAQQTVPVEPGLDLQHLALGETQFTGAKADRIRGLHQLQRLITA